jgi:hypothetical protein
VLLHCISKISSLINCTSSSIIFTKNSENGL